MWLGTQYVGVITKREDITLMFGKLRVSPSVELTAKQNLRDQICRNSALIQLKMRIYTFKT